MIEKLAKNSLFNGVSQEYLQRMVANRVEVNLEPGEFLFHQGDMGRGVYILVDGAVDVLLESGKNNAVKVLTTLKPGDYVGEVCMLLPQERTAGVRACAKGTARLMYIDTQHFLRDVESKDPDALQISHNIALRLSELVKETNKLLLTKDGPELRKLISAA